MRFVAGRFRVLLVAALAATAALAVQARSPIPPEQVAVQPAVAPGGQTSTITPQGTGLLLGQVVDASDNRPIAGATVTIATGGQTVFLPTGEMIIPAGAAAPGAAATGPTAPRQVMTDATGRFMFRDLAKGRYTIRASSPGSLIAGYGQSSPTGTPQPIELGRDDEKRGDLIVRLWKPASLGGTVVDESNEPVIGQSIRLYRRTMSGGRLRLASIAGGLTDDRGVYRISNLMPGEYVVGVMSTQTTMPVTTADEYFQQISSGANFTNSDIYRELSSSGV